MIILGAALCGFALDLLLADPPWMPHPVVWMGKYITGAEAFLRKRLPATKAGELWGGACLAASLPLLTLCLSGGVRALAGRLHPGLLFALETLWCWQCLAVKGLALESRNVYRALKTGTLAEAQRAVGRIVGRDVARLDETGVIKAAVETVAENFSDGVAAPMLYFFLGGAPLALAYKAVNTMDSMVGYRNERYQYFGRAAARLDDAANYLPARIAALFWIAAAFLTGFDGRRALRIWRRDRRNHPSPNSAQTESACAGALGIRLAGPAWYFGEYHDKPYIGDGTREPEPADILRANRMLYAAGVLLLLCCAALRWYLCRGRWGI